MKFNFPNELPSVKKISLPTELPSMNFNFNNNKDRTCPDCGYKVKNDMKFCPGCGRKMDDPEDSENIENGELIPTEPEDEKASAPFMHDSDMAALKALKAIPGFTAFLKSFMSIWNERLYEIINMSSKIKLGPGQMEKYYNMLPPICEKLGIDVPDLYLELDVEPNAYTSGDTKPFITITSGLIETVPEELIPTVLAHECGHIACHHVLYHTMGTMIINGAVTASGIFSSMLGKTISLPLQVAFFYWMRCSELSADRAAAIYTGGSENMTELCLCLAGYDKDILGDASIDLLMEQASAYKEMVASSKWDKTLEFFSMANRTHPYTAIRAYEINEWCKTEDFQNVLEIYK